MQPLTMDALEIRLRAALDANDDGEIRRLARQLDELEDQIRTRRQIVTLAAAALWYAEHDLRVFPLMGRSKIPYPRSHGCHDATTDTDQIRRWWDAAPHSNIGIATGHHVDVIDIDGLPGNKSAARLLRANPDALGHVIGEVSTPRRGGRHLFVPATGQGNAADLAEGIDYRGRGGYVVAPPSHTDAGTYRWTKPLNTLGWMVTTHNEQQTASR